jgi:hypothetical protein
MFSLFHVTSVCEKTAVVFSNIMYILTSKEEKLHIIATHDSSCNQLFSSLKLYFTEPRSFYRFLSKY